jgi:N6-adenosine-specific RNA methylase IME4
LKLTHYQIARGERHENSVRKNLTPSEIVAVQRAIEATERCEARKRQGYRSDLQPPATVAGSKTLSFGDARDKIARFCNKGRTTIARASAVVDAAEQASQEYGHLVAQMDRTGNVASAYRRLEKVRQVKELEASPSKLPSGRFSVIVADPPWRYESDGLPYPTMSIEDIMAMPVVEIAEDNAILWLWVTNTHFPRVFEVVKAWGFEYKTFLTWNKMSMGTGEWLRGQTEHCVLAVRGKPVFLNGKYSTYLEAKRREHSRKPDEFYSLVEATSPGHKVELFARQRREGWHVYGNDVDRFKGE